MTPMFDAPVKPLKLSICHLERRERS